MRETDCKLAQEIWVGVGPSRLSSTLSPIQVQGHQRVISRMHSQLQETRDGRRMIQVALRCKFDEVQAPHSAITAHHALM